MSKLLSRQFANARNDATGALRGLTGVLFGMIFPFSLCIAIRAAGSESKLMKPYEAGSPVNLFLMTYKNRFD